MSDAQRINGNQISWGSIVCKVDGDRYYGFTSLEYGDKRERVHAHGMGKHHGPRGRSRGKYDTEPVKLKGPKSSVKALRSALAAKSSTGTSYGDVEFEITAQFVESGEPAMTVQLERCVIVAIKESHAEGPEVLEDEVTIDCMRVRRDDEVLFDESEGSP